MSSVFVLRCLAAVGAGLGLSLAAGCGGPAPADVRVPIILYLVDTLRADRLGLYGYAERSTSPNLDALVDESVVFDAAYAPAPWTLPSVASIVTSTFSCEHGLVDGRTKLSESIKTLAELLGTVGYDTGAYYSSAWAGPGWGLDRGYAVSENREYQRLGEFLSNIDWPKDTAAFLDRVGQQPFFLYIHTIAPHDPWSAPPEALKRFGHIGIDTRHAIHRADVLAEPSGQPLQHLVANRMSVGVVDQLEVVDIHKSK